MVEELAPRGLFISQRDMVWRRLYERLLLKGAGRPPLLVSTIILPVTNADKLLQEIKLVGVSLDLNNGGVANILIVAGTVPAKKRWLIIALNRDSTTGTSCPAYNVKQGSTFRMSAVQTGAQFFLSYQCLFELPETSQVGCISTGNAADTVIGMRIHYIEEDAY